jgi:glycerol transport system permease protein
MRDEDLQGALMRQITFSLAVLAVEIPLGIALALAMPAKGWQSSAVLVTVAISLLIPWNVVGTIWQIYGRADIGLMGAALAGLGIEYSYTGNPTHAWLTVLLMDVWHWTPLVALLCFAGLRAIPDAYYQAASIDGASKFAVFRYIQLPKLRGVLVIAVLLRFMDSFMIYTEPFVLTGGGARQCHHLPEPVPDAEGGGPVRPGAGRGLLADLLPDHPGAELHPLQLDATRGHGRQGAGGSTWMSAASRSG